MGSHLRGRFCLSRAFNGRLVTVSRFLYNRCELQTWNPYPERRMSPQCMDRRLFLAVMLEAFGCAFAFSVELPCSVCGIEINENEKYFRVQGGKQVFCERCFKEAPRCSICKLPTAQDRIDDATGACSECLARLPRCKACGKPILGTAYHYHYSQGVYCAECRNTRPACYVCGVPVGNTYWQYPDGRTVCSDCGSRAVFDPVEIQATMKDAGRIIARRLNLKLTRPYVLVIERLHGLGPAESDQRETVRPDEKALYGNELGAYRLKDGRSEVILLYGLPPDLLYESAAHEYAHAWQAENSMIGLEPELREGFAQWVAAEVLREKGYLGALEKLEERRDFPYGTGYRRLKILHQRIVIDMMQQRK